MLFITVHALPHAKVAVNASYQCQIILMSIVMLSSFNIAGYVCILGAVKYNGVLKLMLVLATW